MGFQRLRKNSKIRLLTCAVQNDAQHSQVVTEPRPSGSGRRPTFSAASSACIVCQEAADRKQKTPWNEIETSLVMAAA